MSRHGTQKATPHKTNALIQRVTYACKANGHPPGLFSNVDPSWDAIQSSVLRMRLQQILQFLSRSNPEPITSTAPTMADVAIELVPASESTSSHHLPDRLALQSAIIHHLEWCVLFNEHLSVDASGQAPLVPLPSAADSGLGQWLEAVCNGPAGTDPRLKTLSQEHQRFHQIAQQALAFARQGRMDLASTLLNTNFERSRARVLELLRQMQKK